MEDNKKELVGIKKLRQITETPPNGQIVLDENSGKLLMWMDGQWNWVESNQDRIKNLEEALHNLLMTAKALGAGDDWLEVEIAEELLKTTKYANKNLGTY